MLQWWSWLLVVWWYIEIIMCTLSYLKCRNDAFNLLVLPLWTLLREIDYQSEVNLTRVVVYIR